MTEGAAKRRLGTRGSAPCKRLLEYWPHGGPARDLVQRYWKQKNKAQRAKGCWENEKLVILLESSKDWFEPGSIFEADDFVDDCKSLLKELSQIFSLIDTLRLNVKTNL